MDQIPPLICCYCSYEHDSDYHKHICNTDRHDTIILNNNIKLYLTISRTKFVVKAMYIHNNVFKQIPISTKIHIEGSRCHCKNKYTYMNITMLAKGFTCKHCKMRLSSYI